MFRYIRYHWPQLILVLMVILYVVYFSWFSIVRYRTLYAHYFDLGIMHQTVYNTYMSLKTGDFTRFLELTNPHGIDQIKRMAIHNDIFLVFLSPLYFIYSGPETLLVIQSIAVGLGALAVFGISKIVFEKNLYAQLISVFFSFAYLIYPALQRANQFDFHAVVLATPLLLFMFYWYLKKKYVISLLFAIAALLTKEQVGLTIAFFGLFIATHNGVTKITNEKHLSTNNKNTREYIFAGMLLVVGVVWFAVSMMKIIPTFRQGAHFALIYYGDFGDSPKDVFVGLFKNPSVLMQYILRRETYEYLFNIFGPMGFLSILSPLHLLIAAPEFAINLLSKSGAMRNIYFHYTAVITPFVMISSIYGFHFLLNVKKGINRFTFIIIALFVTCIMYFSATLSPLLYSLRREVNPFIQPKKERIDAFRWRSILADDDLKVMASGHIAPLFASRRYLYNFSSNYELADYIVLSQDEVYNGYENHMTKPAYESLINDKQYIKIYKKGYFEVYKKI